MALGQQTPLYAMLTQWLLDRHQLCIHSLKWLRLVTTWTNHIKQSFGHGVLDFFCLFCWPSVWLSGRRRLSGLQTITRFPAIQRRLMMMVTIRSIVVITMIVMIIENPFIITVIFWLISFVFTLEFYNSDVRIISMLPGYNLLYLRINNNVWYQKMFQPYLHLHMSI